MPTLNGKLLRIRETFAIEDTDGKEVATIKQELIAVPETIRLTRAGKTLATIRRALIAPFRDEWMIDVEGGKDMVAKGDLLDHEYELLRADEKVATVSRRWFTTRDTYGIDVKEGEDKGLIVAVAVAIDEMVHDPDEEDESWTVDGRRQARPRGCAPACSSPQGGFQRRPPTVSPRPSRSRTA